MNSRALKRTVLWCPECGKPTEIQRVSHRDHKKNHVKTMWCVNCQRVTHFQQRDEFPYRPQPLSAVQSFFGLPQDENKIDVVVDGEKVLSYGGFPICPNCGYGIDVRTDGRVCRRCKESV